jgi:phospholipase/carboxylesterase
MSSLKTYTHSPKSAAAPKSIVILIHGLGANGQDLIGLARYWETALPDTVFVSPDAPFACDMAPPWTDNSFQWFSLQDRSPDVMTKGAETAALILNEYMDKMLQRYDLKDENLALVGFSQGAMMSLYVGPRRRNKIAGIVAYSGALVGADGLSGTDIQKPPVLLVHGQADSVVPVIAYHTAKDSLVKNGFTVSGHVTPGLDHGIDDEGIESAVAFLSGVLN